MSYKLLTTKLWMSNKKFITREELRKHSNALKLRYESVISYLLNNGYIVRILRGIFYVKTMEERKAKGIAISFYDAIYEALKIKNVNDWYFGLESAIKLNNLTHEYFAIDYIISSKLKRPRPIKILGHNGKFIGIKKGLTKFGIKKEKIPYSDIEKTVLDMIYLGIYNNSSESEIKNRIIDYLPKCRKARLTEYGKHYPATISKLIKKAEKW